MSAREYERGAQLFHEARETDAKWNARQMTWASAAREVSYIQSVNPTAPGKTFNNDPACFQRYRKMQAAAALRDGWPEQAEQMLINRRWPVARVAS